MINGRGIFVEECLNTVQIKKKIIGLKFNHNIYKPLHLPIYAVMLRP